MQRPQAKILLLDPSPDAVDLAALLRAEGYEVETLDAPPEALRRALDAGIDLAIAAGQLPGTTGIHWMREVLARRARLPVILLSEDTGSHAAIEAIKAGAYDFVAKPADPAEIRQAIAQGLDDSRRSSTPVEIGEVYPCQDTIVGRSRAMRDIYKQLGRIAGQPVTILIRGETGTGKELIARAIFQHGHRAHKPFIAVNCAAIPEGLLESELFGHEQGAFTGASKTRIGRFEQAHGGTLFLDEIGDLAPPLQVKLLRVLQEKTIRRVGGQKDLPVDVRILAATHRHLESMVAHGEFREDLFYRINVVSIAIPPLRERPEDIPPLIDYFIDRYGKEHGLDSPSISPKAVEFLQQQDWPGNIRQLQNVIRKALLNSRGYTIGWQDCRNILAESDSGGAPSAPSLSRLVSTVLDRVIRGEIEEALPHLVQTLERELYEQTLRRSGGNQAQAARWLGVSRLTVREKLRQYGLHPAGGRQEEAQ